MAAYKTAVYLRNSEAVIQQDWPGVASGVRLLGLVGLVSMLGVPRGRAEILRELRASAVCSRPDRGRGRRRSVAGPGR